MNEDEQQQHVPNVANVPREATTESNNTVRLPEFWQHDPVMWFKQAEAAFRRGNVTQSLVKYDFVLMKLLPAVVQAVRDLIQAVDDTMPDAYEQLKGRLVCSFGQSMWQQANAIIDHPGVGDTRPSALMNSMLSLLPEGERPGILFLAHFLRRLPAEIRNHLAGAKFDSPRDMAEHADVQWDARGGAAMMAHIDYNTNRGQSPQRRDRWQLPARKSPGRSSRSGQRQQTPGREEKLCFYLQLCHFSSVCCGAGTARSYASETVS
jgi:hypothetical protein